MADSDLRYLKYWGKAQPIDDCKIQWHPAVYHGLDVAAVGDALLKINPQILTIFSQETGLEESKARGWFLFSLALHDIGKFACSFQYKVPSLFHHAAQWKTMQLGADPGHGRTGLALWECGCSLSPLDMHSFHKLFGHDD